MPAVHTMYAIWRCTTILAIKLITICFLFVVVFVLISASSVTPSDSILYPYLTSKGTVPLNIHKIRSPCYYIVNCFLLRCEVLPTRAGRTALAGVSPLQQCSWGKAHVDHPNGVLSRPVQRCLFEPNQMLNQLSQFSFNKYQRSNQISRPRFEIKGHIKHFGSNLIHGKLSVIYLG